MRTLFGLAVLALTVLVPTIASARLGENIDVAQSESRQREFKRLYGAVAPIIEADDDGIVIWECWAGPPNGWTKAQALDFALQLLPAKARRLKLVAGKVYGLNHPYTLSNGMKITLSGADGRYSQVEAYVPAYKGYHC